MDNRSHRAVQSMPRHQGVAIAYSIDCRTQRHIKVVVHVLRNCAAHQVLRRLSLARKSSLTEYVVGRKIFADAGPVSTRDLLERVTMRTPVENMHLA